MRFFRPPVLGSPEQTAAARTFWQVAGSALVIITLTAIAIVAAEPSLAGRRLITSGLLAILIVVLLAANRRGHTRVAGWGLVLGIIAVATLRSWNNGAGLRAPLAEFLFIAVMMAALFIGRVGSTVAAAVAIGAALLLAFGQQFGYLHNPWTGGPWANFSVTAMAITITAVVQNLMADSLRANLRRAESELAERRRADARLRLAVDSGRLGIWEFDTGENNFYADQRTLDFYGLEADKNGALAYDRWLEHVHPEDRQLVLERIAQVVGGTGDGRTEFRVIPPDGPMRYLFGAALLQPADEARAARIIGVNVDVTERKVSEIERAARLEALVETRTAELNAAKDAAETASRAKGVFLASMSHEIRTPMNAILGYSQLLQADEGLGDQQRRRLQVIRSSGEHLLGLINDILEMSRIEAGRVSLSTQPCDLWALLDDVKLMFDQQAAAKDIALVVDRAPSLVRTVRADPGKVRQVVINLVGNALKFMDRGRVIIRASSASVDQHDCVIQIEVEDTGPGIAPDDQAKIFEAFRQAEGGMRRGGTGLGLAISSNFAQMMGGGLSVRSTLGTGSTFTFTFVGRVEADIERSVVPTGRRRLPTDESRRKALVVDDVETNLELATEELKAAGFEVRTALSGEDALLVNDDWQADVVLMDLQMPGMGGYEAIRRLRQAGSTAAIVVNTASVDETAETEVIQCGADAFIRKPAPEGELLNTVARAMNVTFISVEPPAARTDTAPFESPAVALRRVPAALLTQLTAAARQARVSQILKTAAEIETVDPAAAECVRRLVQDFRYDALLSAIEDASVR